MKKQESVKMPSPMIHLLIAYEIDPKAPDLFWVGNFAPDYTNDRQLKDEIHFRNTSNRLEALRQFRQKIDTSNSFEAGWLLHLFVDACWDEIMISVFRQNYQNNYASQDWFVKYREETTLASFYLYHHMDWAHQIWAQILDADLSTIPTVLPILQHEAEWYRERLYKRHLESDINSESIEYSEKRLLEFSRETAHKYAEWMKG